MLAFVLLIASALGWGVHQRQCFLAELETAKLLSENDDIELSGPELHDGIRSSLPLWDARQLSRGRLYNPITHAYFAVFDTEEITESEWDLVASFRYIDSLWIQDMRLPESAVFSRFSSLRELRIARSPLRSEQFESIAAQSQLEEIMLNDVRLGDGDLKFIERLTDLRTVLLSKNPITDSSAKYFRRLKNLQKLYLDDTKVTGDVLRELTCQRSLKSLYLRGVLVRDEDLKVLAEFTNLERLSLSGTSITDAGVHWLTNLEHLRYLYLSDTDVGDETVMILARGSRDLIRVDMEGTRISDASVPLLLEMPSLRLDLCMFNRTDISEVDLVALREASSKGSSGSTSAGRHGELP